MIGSWCSLDVLNAKRRRKKKVKLQAQTIGTPNIFSWDKCSTDLIIQTTHQIWYWYATMTKRQKKHESAGNKQMNYILGNNFICEIQFWIVLNVLINLCVNSLNFLSIYFCPHFVTHPIKQEFNCTWIDSILVV